MNIYRENIMDHYKNPRNQGKLDKYDVEWKENNPLCGDVITVYIKKSDNVLKDMRFKSEGCAISKASASIVSQFIKNKSKEDISALDLESVKKLLGIPLTPSRIKCAMLGLDAIKKAMRCLQ